MALLLVFKGIRQNALVRAAIIMNPGLVGLCAGTAFVAKDYAPALTSPLLYATVALVLVSLPIAIIFIPRALLEQYKDGSVNPDELADPAAPKSDPKDNW